MDANFYFYFRDESAAREGAARLEREGLTVDVHPGADGASWLALGNTDLADSAQLDEYEERFFRVAEELGAEYDGYDRG